MAIVLVSQYFHPAHERAETVAGRARHEGRLAGAGDGRASETKRDPLTA